MEPLVIEGPEQSMVDPALADGGLPPVVGVQSHCVFRASRDVPQICDGKGWTYHHHVDMACWNGRLYVGWNSCEKDEDIWPSHELYSTSSNGVEWSEPAELFPQGVSTALRMYFYLASNGRMLAIAGLRTDHFDTSEDRKGPLVVREIRPDHTLGEVFTLQGISVSAGAPGQKSGGPPPMFDQSSDKGFVDACRELLADRVFLEQQDRGRLLGKRRMKWHEPEAWPDGKVPGDNDKWVCGKAFSFYRRRDGALVGVCKMGWVTVSRDGGCTWSQPVVPSTLITGKAKVWGQRTADGRYALVYNPSKKNRFPLIVVTGDDGERFTNMRIVQGELPIQRYAGLHRSIGPQYVRGISHWANDGSRPENVMWLAYSMSKEDIWVSRVPLPIKPDATADDEPWNIYCPKWAAISQTPAGLLLENRDPYDYARAVKLFPEGPKMQVSFHVLAEQADRGTLDVELMGKFGSPRPVRLSLASDGKIKAADGDCVVEIGSYWPGRWLSFKIDADASSGRFAVAIDGRAVLTDAAFAEPARSLYRLSFRTGPFRGIGGANPVPPGTDRPMEPVRYMIAQMRIRSG